MKFFFTYYIYITLIQYYLWKWLFPRLTFSHRKLFCCNIEKCFGCKKSAKGGILPLDYLVVLTSTHQCHKLHFLVNYIFFQQSQSSHPQHRSEGRLKVYLLFPLTMLCSKNSLEKTITACVCIVFCKVIFLNCNGIFSM